MKKTVLTIVFCVMMAPFLGGVGSAEIKPGSFFLSPSIGGYVFEGNEDLKNNLLYGLGLGYHFDKNWAAEAIFNYVDTETDPGGVDVNAYLYRVEALYHLFPDNRLVPYLAAGIGGITLDPANAKSDSDFMVDYGVGLKYFLNDFIALRGDVRHVLPFDESRNNLAYSVGLTFVFGGQKEKPVAAAPKDTDGDGVFDDADQCPDTPVGVTVDSVGCPLDSDGDGVFDYMDQCPDTPAGVAVDAVGCPLDSDGDGVPDYLDQCPGTPAGTPVDAYGCALEEETEYEEQGATALAAATVESTPALVLKKEKITIDLKIEFDVDKAVIKSAFFDQLKKVAVFMKVHPDTEAVIEGHTDSTASEKYNLGLSQRRAESVRMYLINELGISAQRLTAQGYGEGMPVADNDTDAGRQRNRRAVAVISVIEEKMVPASEAE